MSYLIVIIIIIYGLFTKRVSLESVDQLDVIEINFQSENDSLKN